MWRALPEFFIIAAFLATLVVPAEAVVVRAEKLGELEVAEWLPDHFSEGAFPLVVFSHGFERCISDYEEMTEGMARAGYIVLAPKHADAVCDASRKPPRDPDEYNRRAGDIHKLVAALKENPDWSARIDWEKVGLAGHSMGGYTVLGVAGAHPAWKLDGVKAVLALAPYVKPFLTQGNLATLGVPAMYQVGTADDMKVDVLGKAGAYALTPSPAYLMVFRDATHYAWTNKEPRNANLVRYSLLFLDAYVKGTGPDALLDAMEGLRGLEHK